jgi:hypothetical protein
VVLGGNKVTDLIALTGRRIAACERIVTDRIESGISGETRSGGRFLAHLSTRPGERYRVTTFDSNGEPVGHVSLGTAREVAIELLAIANNHIAQ